MSGVIRSQALLFTGPRTVDIQTREVAEPGPGEVVVESELSAISAGTELLLYRDQMPAGGTVDETIGALDGQFLYPLRYGYALVGKVASLGAGVEASWQGRQVFAFHPHESRFVARVDSLLPVPEGITAEEAAFLPNMETAVSLVMDGRPVIGERVAVFGQGVVGLLTISILGAMPLAQLVAVEGHPLRQSWARRLGAEEVIAPGRVGSLDKDGHRQGEAGADLVYELSGNPEALQEAIEVAGFGGRIVVGSWYGEKAVMLELGSHFHRNHLRLISSQVSHLAPRWQARWSKARRLEIAWEMIARQQPGRLVTHRFPLAQAPAAYRLLDERPGETLQVLLTY